MSKAEEYHIAKAHCSYKGEAIYCGNDKCISLLTARELFARRMWIMGRAFARVWARLTRTHAREPAPTRTREAILHDEQMSSYIEGEGPE